MRRIRGGPDRGGTGEIGRKCGTRGAGYDQGVSTPSAPVEIPAQVQAFDDAATALERGGRLRQATERRAVGVVSGMPLDPRLRAALCLRFGRLADRMDMPQRAVLAYEGGLRLLGPKGDPQADALLRSLVHHGKLYESGPVAAPPPVVELEPGPDLRGAAEDPLLAARLMVALGRAYLAQPQPRPARHVLRRALARRDVQAAPVLVARARVALAALETAYGRIAAATRAIEAARAALPAGQEALELRRVQAALDRRQGRLPEVEAGYRSLAGDAVAGSSVAVDAWTELGWLLLARGAAAEAVAAFDAALQPDPVWVDLPRPWRALWGRGRAAWAAGDPDAAATALADALNRVDQRFAGLATDQGRVSWLEATQPLMDDLVRLRLATQDDRGLVHAIDRAHSGSLATLIGTAARQAVILDEAGYAVPHVVAV